MTVAFPTSPSPSTMAPDGIEPNSTGQEVSRD